MQRRHLADKYRRWGHWRPETLSERFARVCAAHAGREAIIDGDRRLTFGEVDALVERLAGHLAGLGVGAGDLVSFQLPNWWEAVVVHLAALRLGAVPNPLNPIFRARELGFILEEARPKVLVVPRRFRRFDHGALAVELAPGVPSIEHVLVARGSAVPGASELDALLEEPTPQAPPTTPADPGADALLLYTSGTTSDPKGVRHSHETLLYEVDSLRPIHGLTPDDRYLGGAPIGHIAGLVYGVLMPFCLGTTTVFLDRWEPGRALELIDRERLTFQTGTPTFVQTLAGSAEAARADLSSFRLFSTGGASISVDMVRDAEKRLSCVVKRAYGSTEVPTLTATAVDDPEEARLTTDGRPVGPAEVRIVRDGRDVAPGDEGEIWARSPEVFVGYRNPKLDASSFDADGWYRTGDLGRIGNDGYLRVTGRMGDFIIRGGENISVREIEDLLAEHSAVAEATVVGTPDPVLGERACAVVVLRDGASLSFEDMVAHLETAEIARQKIPERLEVRAQLPRTASGKVMKTALRAELARDRS